MSVKYGLESGFPASMTLKVREAVVRESLSFPYLLFRASDTRTSSIFETRPRNQWLLAALRKAWSMQA